MSRVCRWSDAMELMCFFFGALALWRGIPMLIAPTRTCDAAAEARANRLNEIENGASERFFEERRTLEAYSPPKTKNTTLFTGIVFCVGGIYLLSYAVIGWIG